MSTVSRMLTSASRRPCNLPGATDGNNILHYTLHSDRQSSHQQIAQFVRRVGRAPVLDVGAAQGFLGQMLQQEQLQIDGSLAECSLPLVFA